jgi:hypothetical protein
VSKWSLSKTDRINLQNNPANSATVNVGPGSYNDVPVNKSTTVGGSSADKTPKTKEGLSIFKSKVERFEHSAPLRNRRKHNKTLSNNLDDDGMNENDDLVTELPAPG